MPIAKPLGLDVFSCIGDNSTTSMLSVIGDSNLFVKIEAAKFALLLLIFSSAKSYPF